jgi:hypothetical protein
VLAVVTLVRPVWALYASTLIAVWLKLVSLYISCDFVFIDEVIRKRGRFTVVVPSEGDRRVVNLCLTLITSKLVFTNPF